MKSAIRRAEATDIPAMVELSEQKRLQYQPKREMLAGYGHTVASEWWVKPI